MYQQTTILGNVGKEPEMRYTPDGKPVTTFTVAVNQRGNDKPPVWFRVTAWERLAENCNQHVHKSDRVLIAGELQPVYTFIAQDGTARGSYELTARDVRFLGGSAQQTSAVEVEQETEEIPF